ncbi:hypothetical protein [Labedella endophytica]|uniref:Uncharacterized protein n=1 Tax=Labedella endophytica TaxID=1523160 RepID=A0A433JNG4_9MICO|nr:hypothetical protein [Labedella endophytica]RUQ96922.1 hypothetical protein ELQ94_16880 [Labedella endophytica]
MNAAEHLTADLEARRGHPLVKGARFVANLALMAVGGGADDIAVVDLVVRRRDTEREIMRTPADMGDPEILLHQVRRDLESMTIEEFVAEWRLPDDSAP